MATYMHAGKIAYNSYSQLYIRVYIAMYQSKNLCKYIIWPWTNTDFCLKIKMVLYIYTIGIDGYFALMNVLLECIDH